MDYLDESRTAVAIVAALYRGNTTDAATAAMLVRNPYKLVAAYQALCVQFLRVIDQLAIAADLPLANGAGLLDDLTYQMAMSDGITGIDIDDYQQHD